MKKIIAMIIGILGTATVFSAPANMGPATTGSVKDGSYVDVRVTANVVEGIAVNEASPIDFGNLVKDSHATSGSQIYQNGEKIKDNTPGRVVYRANTTGYSAFTTRLERDRINLEWKSDSGQTDNTSTNTTIWNVKIEGIGMNSEGITLVNGQAEKKLNAWFQAYNAAPAGNRAIYTPDYENGNLGRQQKLGNYEGTVRVYAESTRNNVAG